MELQDNLIALAKAVRLRDFDTAEIELDVMVRDDSWPGRAESIAKGRADAEVVLRQRLRDSGGEYVAPERADALVSEVADVH